MERKMQTAGHEVDDRSVQPATLTDTLAIVKDKDYATSSLVILLADL
jgi:hypothetical protein